jgi:hypothetical protein
MKNYEKEVLKNFERLIKRGGNREALERALVVLPQRTYKPLALMWHNARRNQRANAFHTNFGRIQNIQNDPGSNQNGKYITTNKGNWYYFPAHRNVQLWKYGNNGQPKAWATLMGPFNLRNGRLELANRPANWKPTPRHDDTFTL